ncbi:MAG: prepilin-type N-terminal cleavage/methylation domain-containing protein [Candidatus Ozemobacteraceae bacterium]
MKQSSRGFTLMEIMATISIVAVFSSIALPATDNFMSGARATAEAATLVGDIRLGRYEAIRSQQVNRMNLGKLAIANIYTLETFTKDVESNPTSVDVGNPANWANLLEIPRRELSPEVVITNSSNLNTLFFRPDGMIVSSWTPQSPGLPISPVTIQFNYGNATMTVMISGCGALTSEEYYEE